MPARSGSMFQIPRGVFFLCAIVTFLFLLAPPILLTVRVIANTYDNQDG